MRSITNKQQQGHRIKKATDKGPIWRAHSGGAGNSPETYTIPGNLKVDKCKQAVPNKGKIATHGRNSITRKLKTKCLAEPQSGKPR
jgi:hypothetical protein